MYKDEIPVGRAENLKNQNFGYLTALYRVKPSGEKINKSAYWKCKCKCGNIIIIRADSLTKGKTTHCGCKTNTIRHEIKKGDIYGDLTVIAPTEKRANGGNIVYLCKCSCGNLHEVKGNNLTSMLVTSCGCKKISKGAVQIESLLQENKIFFVKEKYIKDCILPTGGHPYFDFYIENKYFVEFDGRQHFEAVGHWGGEEYLKIQIQKDQCKNQWCKDNNIPLIRIPYTKLDTLCLEDLMLETTQFRIV